MALGVGGLGRFRASGQNVVDQATRQLGGNQVEADAHNALHAEFGGVRQIELKLDFRARAFYPASGIQTVISDSPRFAQA